MQDVCFHVEDEVKTRRKKMKQNCISSVCNSLHVVLKLVMHLHIEKDNNTEAVLLFLRFRLNISRVQK